MRGLSRCLMTHSRRHGYMQFLICEKWGEYVLVIFQRDPPLSYNSKGHFSSMTLYYFVEAISGRASVNVRNKHLKVWDFESSERQMRFELGF